MKVILKLIIFFFFLQVFSQEKEVKFNPNKKYSQKCIDSLVTKTKLSLYIKDYKKMLLSNAELHGWMYYYYSKSSILYREKKYDSVLFYTEKALIFYKVSQLSESFDFKIA